MTIDEMCADALARMEQRAEERIAEFRRQSAIEAERVRRSFGQKWRYLKRELIGGVK